METVFATQDGELLAFRCGARFYDNHQLMLVLPVVVSGCDPREKSISGRWGRAYGDLKPM